MELVDASRVTYLSLSLPSLPQNRAHPRSLVAGWMCGCVNRSDVQWEVLSVEVCV